MKIKFLTAIAGVNWSARPKQVVEVSYAEGARYIAAGLAVAADASAEAVPGPVTPKKKKRQ